MSDTKTILAPSQKPVISSTNFITSTSLTKSKPDLNISTIISSSSSVSSISKTIDSNSISTNHDVKESRTETEETEENIIVEGSVKRLAQIYSSGEQHGNHPENIPTKRSDVSKLTMPKQPCEKQSASDVSHLQKNEFQNKDETSNIVQNGDVSPRVSKCIGKFSITSVPNTGSEVRLLCDVITKPLSETAELDQSVVDSHQNSVGSQQSRIDISANSVSSALSVLMASTASARVPAIRPNRLYGYTSRCAISRRKLGPAAVKEYDQNMSKLYGGHASAGNHVLFSPTVPVSSLPSEDSDQDDCQVPTDQAPVEPDSEEFPEVSMVPVEDQAVHLESGNVELHIVKLQTEPADLVQIKPDSSDEIELKPFDPPDELVSSS